VLAPQGHANVSVVSLQAVFAAGHDGEGGALGGQARTVASPMPLLAPLTRATVPVRRVVGVLTLYSGEMAGVWCGGCRSVVQVPL
jgi:hypothetical protein